MRAILSTVALALALNGCVSRPPKAPGPVPSIAPIPAPTGVAAMIVRAGQVDAALRAVAHSSLSQSDRARFAAFMAHNRNRPESYDGQNVRQIINFETAYEGGTRAVREANVREAANYKRLSSLLTARVASVKSSEDGIVLSIRLANKTAKTISRADLRLQIFGAAPKTRLEEMMLDVPRRLAPHATQTFDMPLGYALFSDRGAALTAAALQRKIYSLEARQIEFSDGTARGFEEAD